MDCPTDLLLALAFLGCNRYLTLCRKTGRLEAARNQTPRDEVITLMRRLVGRFSAQIS